MVLLLPNVNKFLYFVSKAKIMNLNILRKCTLSLVIICLLRISVFAGEGMWLPIFLKALNEAEMQSLGMKITAEDIYSINNGSLKDAIVHFGGFCTSELISDEGLLLTNHHCGYSEIQSHSSLEKNYLRDGFWAMSKSEELANPGLFAKFIDQIIDVTDVITAGVENDMTDKERQSIIDKNMNRYETSYKLGPYQELQVRSFYHGNQFFAITSTTYPDVRLVGAPPESIGKFGADTDNWEWPRHTGDFALFRIYAGPNNEPAEYSENNVPYKPKHFLPISLDGVEEGDFTLVFGFPGRTNQYLPAVAVEQLVEKQNPSRIAIRETALGILDKYMRKDESARLQYASKFARVANYWKKWIGESSGLKRTNALEKKRENEERFKAVQARKMITKKSKVLDEFDTMYAGIEDYTIARDYYSEITSRNVELLRVAGFANNLISRYESQGDAGYKAYAQRLNGFFSGFYKNYRADIDQEVFAALSEMYVENLDPKFIPQSLQKKNTTMMGKSYADLSKEMYSNTILTDEKMMMSLLSGDPASSVAKFKEDKFVQMAGEWRAHYDKIISAPYNAYKTQIDSLQRVYMQAQMDAFPDERFYPDANSTMRVTYGQVEGYFPKDGVCYTPVTHLDGVIAKYKPGDYEFDVSAKLLDLYEKKDYGQYAASNGKIPVCFLGSNHTTGGNSGSPAIDAHGNLIGLNFDRVWEGTMSDINYDRSICRNIMVDARYILFIVDKYAGATHLIEEMKLVHPKKMKG